MPFYAPIRLDRLPFLLDDHFAPIPLDTLRAEFYRALRLTPDAKKAEVLSLLAPLLPDDLRYKAVEQVVHLARVADENIGYQRYEAMINLAGLVPAPLGRAAVNAALTLPNLDARAIVLAGLGPHLSESEKEYVVERILSLSSDSMLSAASEIFPFVEDRLRRRIIDAVSDEIKRDLKPSDLYIITHFAPNLLATFRPELLPTVLSTIRGLPRKDRGPLLEGIAPYLPESLHREALALARMFRKPALTERFRKLLGVALTDKFRVAALGRNALGLFSYFTQESFQADKAEAASAIATKLPKAPPRLWPGRPRGRPKAAGEDMLVTFLRETYGPFMAEFRNELRAYIFNRDPLLYQAIQDYERGGRRLPKDLFMPTERARMSKLIERAQRVGFERLLRPERRTISRKIARHSKPKP